MVFTLVLDLGKTVKNSIQKHGMLAWQYNTIGVSDAITMGGEGMTQDFHMDSAHLSTDTGRNEIFSPEQGDHCRQYRNCHVRTAS